MFITQNGYPHPPYTCIRLQKTWSPAPASVITETARKCGGVLALSLPLPRRAEGFTTCNLRLSNEARSPAAPCRLLYPAHWYSSIPGNRNWQIETADWNLDVRLDILGFIGVKKLYTRLEILLRNWLAGSKTVVSISRDATVGVQEPLSRFSWRAHQQIR